MTEDTGFSPEVPAAPEPPPVQEEAPAPEEPSEAPDAAEDDAPYVPDNQPGWLVNALQGLHERLSKLEGH